MVHVYNHSVWSRRDIVILCSMTICLTFGLISRQNDKDNIVARVTDVTDSDIGNHVEVIRANTLEEIEGGMIDQIKVDEHDVYEAEKINNENDRMKKDHVELPITTESIQYSSNEPLYLNRLFPNENYPPFQPRVTEDFPTTVSGYPRIPHILHQGYSTNMFPLVYSNFSKLLVEKHPKWKYYFWTEESTEKLIKDRYPYLLEVWERMGNSSIHRNHLSRYVVIHEFGGAYIDSDFETLRPLDQVTMKYTCVIPTEPFEHSVFVYNTHFQMTNKILFCKPRHPFFRQILDNIYNTFVSQQDSDRVNAGVKTGPELMTQIFIRYHNIDMVDANRTKTNFTGNSPYFYRGEMSEMEEYSIYVPNTGYFTDELDLNKRLTEFNNICKKFNDLPYLIKRSCVEMERRFMDNSEKQYKFLSHAWIAYDSTSVGGEERTVNIRECIPTCTIYGE